MPMKQVIIVRKDLGMRKGKMIAQGCHASLGAVLPIVDNEAVGSWIAAGSHKICVYVSSEGELLDIYDAAKSAGLPCSLIKDRGLTEFKEPTYTCVAIGPAQNKKIDPITENLKLL